MTKIFMNIQDTFPSFPKSFKYELCDKSSSENKNRTYEKKHRQYETWFGGWIQLTVYTNYSCRRTRYFFRTWFTGNQWTKIGLKRVNKLLPIIFRMLPIKNALGKPYRSEQVYVSMFDFVANGYVYTLIRNNNNGD